jgi:hypothetical protein
MSLAPTVQGYLAQTKTSRLVNLAPILTINLALTRRMRPVTLLATPELSQTKGGVRVR